MTEKKRKFLIIFIAGEADRARSPKLAVKFNAVVKKVLGSATPISKSGVGGALVYAYSAASNVDEVARALTARLLSSDGFLLDPIQRSHDALLVIDVSEQGSWYATSDVYRAAASLG